MSGHQLYGGIEAGGTKFICVVGSGPENILEQTRIDTKVPEETLGKVIRSFNPTLWLERSQRLALAVSVRWI